jgi:hypothetical protein
VRKPHIETVEIRCACNEFTMAIAPGLDIPVADFLKGAIYRGWRLIDNDDHAEVTVFADGGADILLNGLCAKCAAGVSNVRLRNVLGAGSHDS